LLIYFCDDVLVCLCRVKCLESFIIMCKRAPRSDICLPFAFGNYVVSATGKGSSANLRIKTGNMVPTYKNECKRWKKGVWGNNVFYGCNTQVLPVVSTKCFSLEGRRKILHNTHTDKCFRAQVKTFATYWSVWSLVALEAFVAFLQDAVAVAVFLQGAVAVVRLPPGYCSCCCLPLGCCCCCLPPGYCGYCSSPGCFSCCLNPGCCSCCCLPRGCRRRTRTRRWGRPSPTPPTSPTWRISSGD
jgi:hypothetical protein